ncbi:MAG TPA: site-specific DNA-methyltransferase [Candidatus Pacearchaeota archaeon]|nr:site-specific DNA-methyltransferase [Candidatus Pacearchaeota archaeon]
MASNSEKYKDYSREELIDELETLKKKKYGLVWDKKNSQEMLDAFVNWENVPENFMPKKFPVLKEVKNKEIENDKDKPVNLLIEGDNYHSLAVLNFTHREKIDVIYIDPPYNTGNKDFMYNDKFIDKDDPFRHSKWLSFMEKRLRLAQKLLKNTGVIFISIDHNEQAQLKLLCDEIFGEENFQREIIWRIGWLSGFKTLAPNFIRNHDTILMYSKNHLFFEFNKEYIENKDFKPILKPNEKVREKLLGLGLNKSQQAELLKFINYENRPERYPIEDTWNCNEYDDLNSIAIVSFSGEKVSKYIGTEEFDGQKPIKLIKRILKSRRDKSATILDFFAGSGTTGHAVLDMNKEDGGNRKFILCTNNENNIATNVCYPRIEKAINGSGDKKVAGLSGNLKYFRTDFVGSDSTDKNRRDLVNKSAEMICIKEDIFDLIADGGLDYKIYQKDKKFLGIIFDFDSISDFKKEAEKHKGNFVVYCFSYTEATPEKEFKGLKNKYVLKPIPAVILRIYLEIFKK